MQPGIGNSNTVMDGENSLEEEEEELQTRQWSGKRYLSPKESQNGI